jgi:hypothetical protein
VSLGWIQLWIERQALDPAASTAGHTLQLLLGRDAPVRVDRADLWELAAEGATEDTSARFESWFRTSNLFLNPNRDRAILLGDTAPLSGASIASVVTTERGSSDSRAHALTVGHALGGKWRVRRGTVWTLLWPPERAAEVPALAEKAAWARRRSSGLLVNPESQDAVLLVGKWACPALPGGTMPERTTPDGMTNAEPRTNGGGADGGTA